MPRLSRALAAAAPVAVSVVVAGCGFVNAGRNSDIKPDGFVLRGYVSVPAGVPAASGSCVAEGDAVDIRVGTPVTVTDGAGVDMGSTALGTGVRDGNDCNFPFQVPAVPRRDDRYLIRVGERPPVAFAAVPLRQDKPAVITIAR